MKRLSSLQTGTPSPCGLAAWGVLLLVIFATAHLGGLREQVSVLSGTLPAHSTYATAQAKAVIYLAGYFGAVVVAPILLLAAALLILWNRLRPSATTG